MIKIIIEYHLVHKENLKTVTDLLKSIELRNARFLPGEYEAHLKKCKEVEKELEKLGEVKILKLLREGKVFAKVQ